MHVVLCHMSYAAAAVSLRTSYLSMHRNRGWQRDTRPKARQTWLVGFVVMVDAPLTHNVQCVSTVVWLIQTVRRHLWIQNYPFTILRMRSVLAKARSVPTALCPLYLSMPSFGGPSSALMRCLSWPGTDDRRYRLTSMPYKTCMCINGCALCVGVFYSLHDSFHRQWIWSLTRSLKSLMTGLRPFLCPFARFAGLPRDGWPAAGWPLFLRDWVCALKV